jgi:tetratricopeptide (TPR) repeat protein
LFSPRSIAYGCPTDAATHERSQDYRGALATFEEGARRWPEEAGFRAGASRAAYRVEDYATALSHAEALATRDAATAGDHFWHAVVLERLEETDRSVAAYEMAVAGDGANWIALNNLASLVTDADPDRAVDLARRAAEVSGGNPQVRTTLAWALHTAGASAEALELLRELTVRDPGNAVVAYRLGRVLLETGEPDAGRSEIARALEMDPAFRHADAARRLLSEN